MLSIVIGIPIERTISEQAFWAFMRISNQGWPILCTPYDRVDAARNHMVEALLGSEHEYLLMLDSDHVHPWDIVQRLGRWPLMNKERYKIVGGLNFRRGKPFDPCAFVKDENGNYCRPATWGQGLLKVDAIGFGCVLFHRSVFEAMGEPWFYYEYKPESNVYPTEDVTFCKRAQGKGFDIFCDTTTTSPHLGVAEIGADTWRMFSAAHPEECMSEPQWLFETIPALVDRPGRVLYVGAAPKRAAYTDMLKRAEHQLDLLEAWEPNAAHYRGNGLFQNVFVGDVRTAELVGQYDYAFWWHGPEHIAEAELAPALTRLEAVSRMVILGSPFGHYPQGAVRGNPYEEHKQHLIPETLQKLGYHTATRKERGDPESCLLAWKET